MEIVKTIFMGIGVFVVIALSLLGVLFIFVAISIVSEGRRTTLEEVGK